MISSSSHAVVIGGGPAGLMAAEQLLAAGIAVDLYDAMPSLGRKFLMAGRGGLNLTHSEPIEPFLDRYATRRSDIEPLLRAFGPDDLRDWAHGLGVETFVGSSGRVFPAEMKAAPLLRTWLQRLRSAGLRTHVRHRWLGWHDDGALRFATPQGEVAISAEGVVLALGGGSWARLGSDAAWVPWLAAHGVDIAPLQPANCGFDVAWSEHLRSRFAGEPLKAVVLHAEDALGNQFERRGEFVLTETGVEGSLIYAASAMLRDEITRLGRVTIQLDLVPDRTEDEIAQRLSRPRGKRSFSNHLKRQLNLPPVKIALLHEQLPRETLGNSAELATALKRLPLTLDAPRPIDEAISTAGGVTFAALTDQLMVRALPGLFCAGEMLDWEAPTGGYLLTACFASGVVAGRGLAEWLRSR